MYICIYYLHLGRAYHYRYNKQYTHIQNIYTAVINQEAWLHYTNKAIRLTVVQLVDYLCDTYTCHVRICSMHYIHIPTPRHMGTGTLTIEILFSCIITCDSRLEAPPFVVFSDISRAPSDTAFHVSRPAIQ